MTPMPSAAALGKLMVLSPHLDDGVFSCAELLSLVSGATVVTICAAVPPISDVLPEWDAAAGFANAQQAVAARREEDRQALALLHAQPYWLDFCDSQYGVAPDAARVAAVLAVVMHAQHPDSVLIPAGLFHADHRLTHRAALIVRRDFAHLNWFMYEDALYRRITGLLQQRLAVLQESGIDATPAAFDTSGNSPTKARAVRCYRSQLRALMTEGRPGHHDLTVAERYWHITSSVRL